MTFPASARRGRLAAQERRQEPSRARPLGALAAARARIEAWLDRARERGKLAQLTDRELRDIGLNRYDAQQECRKPFWRP